MLPYRINFVIDRNALDAFIAVRNAHEGDVKLLALRCERGARLSDQERVLIAQMIRGEFRLPKSRPRKGATVRKREIVATFMYVMKHLTGYKQEALIEDAKKQYGVERSYIMGALKQIRNDPEREQIFDGMAEFIAEAARDGGIPDLPVKDVPWSVPGVSFTDPPTRSGPPNQQRIIDNVVLAMKADDAREP